MSVFRILLAAAGLLAAQERWFKTYPTAPFKEYWTLNLEVRRLDKALPDITKEFSKAKATLVVPLANLPASINPPTQQLRYSLSLSAAKRVVKRLRTMGKLADLQIRPALDRSPAAEIRQKRTKLEAERAANARAFQAMPNSAALVEEALEHMRQAEKAQEPGDSDVLLNMTVLEVQTVLEVPAK